MKNKQRFFLLLFLLSLTVVTFAQQRTITGRVVDATNETLPGVSIVVKGTTTGTVTNIDGNFELSVSENENTLLFSFVGFNTKEVSIAGLSTVNVQLESSVVDINEVVVVGYGVVKKSDLTGAVSKVKAKDLVGPSTPDAVSAMQGKVAGVTITSNSGEPGSGMKINIRGVGSWANSTPLYVVDGFPIGDISGVDPASIENIEILKDASATAIYGSRGANGVVLVTTKKGLSGSTVFEASAYTGVQKASHLLDMCNASEYATLRKEAYANDGMAVPYDEGQILDYAINNNSVGTNWQDEVFRVAPIHNYSISARGGNELNKFNVGATYFDQQGLIKNSGMQKMFLYLNNQYQLSKKVSLDANVSYSTYQKNNHNNDAWNGSLPVAVQTDPISTAWDSFTNNYGKRVMSGTALANAAQSIDASKNQTQSDQRFVTNVTLNINDIFTKGLSFRTMGAAQLVFAEQKYYLPVYYIDADQQRKQSSLRKQRNNQVNLTWNGFFNYTKEIGDHSINATVGMEVQDFNNDNMDGTRYDVPSTEELMYFNQSSNGTQMILTDGAGENRILSYFGRANYSFQGKYLLTATMRADGSSKFSPENQWGYFPSFSAGWNVKEEGFMQNVNALDRLKVRAGWGQVGNANAAGYNDYLSTMNTGYTYVIGGVQVEGAKVKALSNPDLKWEVSEQLNIGTDITILAQRLDMTLDYFNRTTKDMQISKPIPEYVGTGRPTVNAASMVNKGFEFTINWSETRGAFKYNVGINGLHNKSEITDMAGGEAIAAGNITNIGNTTRTETGYEMAYFYGYKTDGIFNTAEELAAHSKGGVAIQSSAKVGDVKFLDLNNDGKIDDKDKTYLGSATPSFSGGLNAGVEFKGVDFKMSWFGVTGNEIVNGLQTKIGTSGILSNYDTNRLNRWSIDNPNGTEPRMTRADLNSNMSTFSDRFVEDGSYIRLKNIQLGYTLPKTLISKLHLTNVRVYASCDNLITITKYTGWTPEVGDLNGDPLSAGVDFSTYPTPIILTGGISVTF